MADRAERPDGARDASVRTEGDRHVLQMERSFAHPIERVWASISDPARLSKWWPMKIDDLPLSAGAAIRFYDEQGTESTGTITDVEPGRVLAFVDDKGEHAMRFELTPQSGGCRLVFTHSLPSAQPPAQFATGWHFCFRALEAVVADETPPPLGFDPELMSEYEKLLS